MVCLLTGLSSPTCHPRPSIASAMRGEGDPGGHHRDGVNRLGRRYAVATGFLGAGRASPGMTLEWWRDPRRSPGYPIWAGTAYAIARTSDPLSSGFGQWGWA